MMSRTGRWMHRPGDGARDSRLARARLHMLAGGLALVLLGAALIGCSPSHSPSAPTSSTLDPHSRMHNVTPGETPLFVRVTFTPATTFEQAVAILGSNPYPWDCDAPRTPAPPSQEEQRAAFAASHRLYLWYPDQNQLVRIASSPQVVSVDGTPLFQCP